ncbi:MAG: hypothetical protein AAB932_03975, partial [Patescibacteria group bacterium]
MPVENSARENNPIAEWIVNDFYAGHKENTKLAYHRKNFWTSTARSGSSLHRLASRSDLGLRCLLALTEGRTVTFHGHVYSGMENANALDDAMSSSGRMLRVEQD